MRIPVCLLIRPLVAAFVTLCMGCSGGRDATEKQLAELRAEITRLRATQAALSERVDTLEIDRGAFGKVAAPATVGSTASAGSSDRPELAVVRLSPSEGDGDADSDTPRPVVRAVGSDGSIQRSDGGKRANLARGSKNGAVFTSSKQPDPRSPVKP